MAHPTQTKDLLTVKEAAANVSCSESTIKRRIRSGELPAKTFGKSGRAYLIDPKDLEKAFVSARFGEVAQSVATNEAERIEAIAAEIAASAPKLSPERRARLAELLR